jgi:hypothetical protein
VIKARMASLEEKGCVIISWDISAEKGCVIISWDISAAPRRSGREYYGNEPK